MLFEFLYIIFLIIGMWLSVKYKSASLFSAVSIWHMTTIWMDAKTRTGTVIMSLRGSGYPDDKCITPKKFKFLFEYREDVEGGYNIPKEIAQINIFGFYNLIVSAIVLVFTWGKLDGGISFIYAEVDIVIVWSVMILLRFKAVKVAFDGKYKKMNRYNWKYVLDDPKQELELKIIGECKVAAVKRKGRRKYVTIEMLSTGEKLEDILFCGTLYKGMTYMLYEICHLKYVDHIPPKKVRKPIENCKVIGGKTIRQKK